MPEYRDLTRSEIHSSIPHSVTSLLDVGCFHGGFGAALKAERNLFVWGIEADPVAASIAATRLDRITVGTFPQAAPNRLFDCITFLDCLEHMEDPWTALSVARDYLGPAGTIVASIPNVGHFTVIMGLIRGRFAYADAGILDRTHLRFFTKQSIMELFRGAGLNVTSIVALGTDPSGSRLERLLALAGERSAHLRAAQYLAQGRRAADPGL
jgi:2-polyprenyl-3-methyl-5-hydroxy-6-metoxy-1,4-benzoquinol methylase